MLIDSGISILLIIKPLLPGKNTENISLLSLKMLPQKVMKMKILKPISKIFSTVPRSGSLTFESIAASNQGDLQTCGHILNLPMSTKLVRSLDLGGTTIIFAQNWNFELKFVLVNHFWKKMTSRQFKIHFLYKFESKMPQNRTVSKNH